VTRVCLGLTALALAVSATPAAAWPSTLTRALLRDAQRIVPQSLARLVAEREDKILEEAQRFPPQLGQMMAADLTAGKLQPETLAAMEAHAGSALTLIKEKRVSEGLVRLGAVLRIPADLADPVLSAGPEGYPAGVVGEYYAFIEGNLNKIPVVLDDAPALKLERKNLATYWQQLLGRSREQSGVIRTELFQNGRIVSHSAIDYRSPVFGVASLSYSRAVTAIAATWMAVWREAKGDITRQPAPSTVAPDAPASPAGPQPPPLEGPKP
jgi:hypothetical protein